MKPSPVTVNVTKLIDDAPLGRFQVAVVALCALIAMLDGFDTQSVSFVAPVIAALWKASMPAFGAVFAAGLLGLTIGAFVFGPVADRFGRKGVLLACTALFGAFTIATAFATGLRSLLVLRVLAGIGLGGAMPNIIAVTSEYAPSRLRATTVAVMFCGFPLGSTVGGFLAAWMIPRFGWQSVFWVGGVLPVLLLPLLAALLPESIRFLVARRQDPARIARILARVDPERRWDPATERYEISESRVAGFSGRQLFTQGRAGTTLLLWTAYFCNLLVMYFLVNWLPALFKKAGLTMSAAIMTAAMLNLGGVLGGVGFGRLIDRMRPYTVLGTAYAFAAACILLMAGAGTNLAVLLPSVFFAGIGVVGAQIGMNAVSAGVYPTALRSTGVGWALGIGRVGSIVGPTVGAALLAMGWETRAILSSAAGPALAAALAVYALGRHRTGAEVLPRTAPVGLETLNG